MPSLQIRELPDDIYQALSLRSEREHRSLAQQALVDLRGALRTGTIGRRRRILDRIRADLLEGGHHVSQEPETLIREDRER